METELSDLDQIFASLKKQVLEDRLKVLEEIEERRRILEQDLRAGTWLQQVTLCSSPNCPLYPVRPQTKSQIPESVLRYYQVGKMGTSQDLSTDKAA